MTKALPQLAAMTAAVLFASACTTTSNFSTAHPDAKVSVKSTATDTAPRSETMNATSFGNYEFKVEKEGSEPMYGILPLKFNGGYLTVDILFFAPGLFFNLREPFPYYEFDAEKNLVRYKKHSEDPWTEYTPLPTEAERAKNHFNTNDKNKT